MEHSKKAIKIALENGAEYCDIRTEWSQKFGVLVENGLIEQSNSRFISGIGIRVLYNGAWGFFSTSENDGDRKSTRLNSSHIPLSRMPSSA